MSRLLSTVFLAFALSATMTAAGGKHYEGVWGPWCGCSESCGGGLMTRECFSKGSPCAPALCEGPSSMECNTEPCPVSSSTASSQPPDGTASESSSAPAVSGSWSAWHVCSVSCGGGVTYRDCLLDNAIVDNSLCEGNATTECNTEECPVVESSTAVAQPPDGTASESSTAPAPIESSTGEEEEPCVGAWGPWSDCSRECGCGEQSRCCFFNGKQVKDKFCEGESKRECNTDACAPPAESSTAPAEESSSTAPAPVESSTAVSQPPDGTASESSTGAEEEEPCVGAWGPWSDCSRECGCGEQSRCCFFKGKQVKDKYCDGESKRECNTDACAPPAESSTAPAEESSSTAPAPVSSSTASSQPPDGTASESSTGEEEEPCVGAWGPWSDCSRECGCGEQSRCCFFNGKQVKDKFCEGESKRECNTDACAPPAESSTAPAEESSSTAPAPVSSSTASSQPPDGTASESSTGAEEEEPCVGAWGPWTECSASCDGGKQSRCCFFKGKQVKDKYCEGESHQDCNTEACPVSSSTASSQPPDGTASESSTAPAESSTGEEEEPCVGAWGPWSDCSASCDGGKQSRCCFFKGKQVKDKYCEGRSKRACNTDACVESSSTAPAESSSTAPAPVTGTWGNWFPCSVSCGGGVTFRFCYVNGVQTDASFCEGPSTTECNSEPCVIESSTATSQPPDGTGSFPSSSTGSEEVCWCRCPCQAESSSSSSGPYGSTAPAEEFGTWSAWHACSVSCGGGVTYRDCIKDGMIVDNAFCPTGNATTECNTDACPVSSSTAVSQPPDGTASESSTGKDDDCVCKAEGTWTEWSLCSANCSGGFQYRVCLNKTGQTVDDAICEGAASRECNTEPCPEESSTAVSQPPDGTASEESSTGKDCGCPSEDHDHESSTASSGSPDGTGSEEEDCDGKDSGKGKGKYGKGGKKGKGKGKRWPAWFHF